MTRDRLVEVTKKGDQRVAEESTGTPAKQKYVKRLAELKIRRAATGKETADGPKQRLRA